MSWRRDHPQPARPRAMPPSASACAVAAAGTHPFSNWDGPDHLARRPLRQHRRGAATARAVAADLRPARPRRRAGSIVDDRPDERGALLPAAPARALDQLAVLDGSRHGAEVVPDDHLPPVSAHRGARSLRLVERIREVRRAARRAALHRQRKKIWWDVRPQPTFGTLEFRVCDVPTRPADSGHARRARAGDRRQAVPSAHPEPGLPALPARAHRREQVARRALGPRRQADRLRQAAPKCRCATSRSSSSSSSTMWWTIWGAGGPSSTCIPCSARARAPTSNWRCSGRRATCKAVVQHVIRQTRDGVG